MRPLAKTGPELPANVREWPTAALEDFIERSAIIWADHGAIETLEAKRAADRAAEFIVRTKWRNRR